MKKVLLFFLGVLAIVGTLVTIVVFAANHAATSSAPPPPPADEHLLRRHFEGVDASKKGKETYVIKGVVALKDPETHWGLVFTVAEPQELVDLNACIGQVGINTNFTELKPQSICGSNVQARCLVLKDGDCQPANP